MGKEDGGGGGSGGPDLVEELHEGVVDHEGDAHVEAHATQTRHRPLVEPTKGPNSLLRPPLLPKSIRRRGI